MNVFPRELDGAWLLDQCPVEELAEKYRRSKLPPRPLLEVGGSKRMVVIARHIHQGQLPLSQST